ncbi:GspE/PulE family protein [Vibrio cholerae]|uniref:GspE/PulE family protein n=1 Tax=Vibrio cholerae TaxID=666 RepID=UPI000218F38B|nr:GspE/PulE family protein [Vibrio cholerae]EGR10455.1 putative general secretion pathway protein E [Vibrio cholerae HE48]BCN22006.1 putative type II secretion system protein [Vibrio cholerae]GIB62863.1 Type IV fimbrial assembly, ATPase PilB [Vibrio cholerae]
MLLGERLKQKQLISNEDIEQIIALQEQAPLGKRARFGELCVSHGLCSEQDILTVLSEQLELQLLADILEQYHGGDLPPSDLALSLFPAEWWQQRQAFPLLMQGSDLYVAQSDVWDDFVFEAILKTHQLNVIPVLCSNYEMRQLLSTIDEQQTTATALTEQDSSSAPVVKFVNECIQRAIKENASDIHFEVNKQQFSVRYRVDGVLRTVDQPGMAQHAAILSRIKLMAGLDISEKRLPQDGRIRVRLSGLQVDIRVATTPTVYGENAVLRLLANEKQNQDQQRKELNMLPDQKNIIQEILSKKTGIFLITGPTGSGKTTSLYTLLGQLNDDQTKIITVEDPVEYQMKGLTQIQVNADIGLSFAHVLRSALRQDPDIILIGEMRDKETSQIAIQSALTGHFVLSTLHTNDAPSSFIRLKDIGIPDYLIKSTVVGIMAQRLVRKLCPHCKQVDKHGEQTALSLGYQEVHARWGSLLPDQTTWYKAVGCEHCNDTGYSGRLAIFELLGWSEEETAELEMVELQQVAKKQNMRNLRQDALMRAALGDTTLEEVLRVVG